MMQLLQTLMADRENERAERQANLAALQQIAQNNHGHGNHDHPGSKLKNFQNTNPPMFSKTEEPLDADDWLQTMENNLEVAGVEAAEKGLIKKMRDEFRELKQGRMSVVEYRDRFLTLSRRTPKPGGNNNNTTNPNSNNNNGNNNNIGPRTGSNAIPVATKDKATITCYECGVVGHYSNECPKRLAKIAPTLLHCSEPAPLCKKEPEQQQRRLYNMTATEAQEAPQAMPSRVKIEAHAENWSWTKSNRALSAALEHHLTSLHHLHHLPSPLLAHIDKSMTMSWHGTPWPSSPSTRLATDLQALVNLTVASVPRFPHNHALQHRKDVACN
ncbi:hypothetical protein QYE76_031315 [Lolium multiflorum]|uniref:CCHC-type domain-containing protein n=1 Tax=Lolium multiflorum TaxID=4521 RepID=A0AAD8QRX3_LOLMU|nr:hypothetical protein QYE76_031315 [Lolium multiflorum]